MPTINKEIGERLILTLYEAYQANRLFYEKHNSSQAPQNIFVPDGVEKSSRIHACQKFFATLTDRRQVSTEVYKSHKELFDAYPEFYTEEVLKLSAKELEEILIGYRIGVPRQSAKYWLVCAKTLFGEFDGNPLSLYSHCGNTVEGIQEYRAQYQKEHGFNPLPGYGPKISSLYALYLAELGLLEFPKDAFAVDVHAQRIFMQTGAITLSKRLTNESLEKVIRPFICEACEKYGLNKIDLSHAFWFLGSVLCTNCYRRGDIVHLCPAYSMCSGPINTKEYFARGFWNLLDDPGTKMRKGDAKVFCIANGPLFNQK